MPHLIEGEHLFKHGGDNPPEVSPEPSELDKIKEDLAQTQQVLNDMMLGGL